MVNHLENLLWTMVNQPEMHINSLEKIAIPPRSVLEEVVLKICVEALEIEKEPFGVYDSLLEPLQNPQCREEILSSIQDIFEIDLTDKLLLERVSVADLAHVIVEQEEEVGKFEAIAQTLKEVWEEEEKLKI